MPTLLQLEQITDRLAFKVIYFDLYFRHRSRRGGSDDESEVSGVSMASARHRDRHRDSGSESESGRSAARKNHRRRKRSGIVL